MNILFRYMLREYVKIFGMCFAGLMTIYLVIDFFDFRIWPVFNVADIAIVLGVAGMIFAILFRMNERE